MQLLKVVAMLSCVCCVHYFVNVDVCTDGKKLFFKFRGILHCLEFLYSDTETRQIQHLILLLFKRNYLLFEVVMMLLKF